MPDLSQLAAMVFDWHLLVYKGTPGYEFTKNRHQFYTLIFEREVASIIVTFSVANTLSFRELANNNLLELYVSFSNDF